MDVKIDPLLFGLSRQADVKSLAVLPTASADLAGTIYHRQSDNTYWVVNDAGTGWYALGLSGASCSHVFEMTIPTDPDDDWLHFQVQFSVVPDFASTVAELDSSDDQSAWSVFNGSRWEAVGASGVPPGYYGFPVAVEVAGLTRGTMYYVRYRASDDGGTTWTPWKGAIYSC